MVEWITKIIELAKVPTKLIGSICIASGILLIFPNDWLQKLHLSDFSKDFGKYIEATFLLTCAILCIEAFLWLSKSYRIKREKSHAEKKAIMAPYNLDDKEIEWVKKNRPEFINELERRKSVLFGW